MTNLAPNIPTRPTPDSRPAQAEGDLFDEMDATPGDAETAGSVMALCERHRNICIRQEQLCAQLVDLEAMLALRHGWLELTRMQRRTLPAAQAFYELDDELDRLGREGAQLVVDLLQVRSASLDEAIAKLDVVARTIEPDDYVDAHAVLADAIADLRRLSQQDCAMG